MDGDVPKENLSTLEDVWECLITYELSEDYLSEAGKQKVIQCSNKQKERLHETIDSSSIQYHKSCQVTCTSNSHINGCLKRKCAEEP